MEDLSSTDKICEHVRSEAKKTVFVPANVKHGNKFETLTESIFKTRVKVDTSDLEYVEFGIDFIRFRVGENLFEVRVKDKSKKKKI